MPIVIPQGIWRTPEQAGLAGLNDAAQGAVGGALAAKEMQRTAELLRMGREELELRRKRTALEEQAFSEEQTQRRALEQSQGQAIDFKAGQLEQMGQDVGRPGGFVGPQTEQQFGKQRDLQNAADIARKMPSQAAGLAFLQDVKTEYEEREIEDSYANIAGTIQDSLVGLAQIPGAEKFQGEFEAAVQMLDQAKVPGLPSKVRAHILDLVGERVSKTKALVYESVAEEEDRALAVNMLTELLGQADPTSPGYKNLQMAKIGVMMGDVKGADIIRNAPRLQLGDVQMEDGSWAPPEVAARIQQGNERVRLLEEQLAQKQSELESMREYRARQQELRAKELEISERNAATSERSLEQRAKPKPVTSKDITDRAKALQEGDLLNKEAASRDFNYYRNEARKQLAEERGATPAVGPERPEPITAEERAALKAEGYTDEQIDALGRGK